jgi:hypothetical protein
MIYAAENPDEISGVINFVGGWLGETCHEAFEINAALFRRGGQYNRPTLWVYGNNDRY